MVGPIGEQRWRFLFPSRCLRSLDRERVAFPSRSWPKLLIPICPLTPLTPTPHNSILRNYRSERNDGETTRDCIVAACKLRVRQLHALETFGCQTRLPPKAGLISD